MTQEPLEKVGRIVQKHRLLYRLLWLSVTGDGHGTLEYIAERK